MKKHFNKKLVMTQKDDKDFENTFKCWICDDIYVVVDTKVRDHSHINGKYRGSAHKGFNINIKLNDKLPIVFNSIKNYDSHLIMQELGKFIFKINAKPNGLEKYMRFNINNKCF